MLPIKLGPVHLRFKPTSVPMYSTCRYLVYLKISSFNMKTEISVYSITLYFFSEKLPGIVFQLQQTSVKSDNIETHIILAITCHGVWLKPLSIEMDLAKSYQSKSLH